jgi:hypothetical protein
MWNKQRKIAKINFPEQGVSFLAASKNSLRVKLKSLKCILSSWVRNLLCVLSMYSILSPLNSR